MPFNKLLLLQKILNSASNTVNIINEVKPIYNDLKPLIIKGANFLNKQTPIVLQNNAKVVQSGPKFFL